MVKIMPMCGDSKPVKGLVCPECGREAVTLLNGSVYQCCARYGGCGHASLNEGDFRKVQSMMP